MSSEVSGLRIYVYGRNKDRIDETVANFRPSVAKGLLLKEGMTPREVINEVLSVRSLSNILFINSDTMKKVNIVGFESVNMIVDNITSRDVDNKPFMVMFNRYHDYGFKTQYIREILSGVSLFRNYCPGESDCFYLSSKLVKKIQNEISDGDYIGNAFSNACTEEVDCFSFNPNLYTYRIEDSTQSYANQQKKTSMLKPEERFNINESAARFFSSHLLLFWFFFVFFTITVFIIVVRVFKIGKFLV